MNRIMEQFIELLRGKPMTVKADALAILNEIADYDVKPDVAIKLAYVAAAVMHAYKWAATCGEVSPDEVARRLLRGINAKYTVSFPDILIKCCGCTLIIHMPTRRVEHLKCRGKARSAKNVIKSIVRELAITPYIERRLRGVKVYEVGPTMIVVKMADCIYPVIIASTLDELVVQPTVVNDEGIECAERLVRVMEGHPLYGEDFRRAERWLEYWRRMINEVP